MFDLTGSAAGAPKTTLGAPSGISASSYTLNGPVSGIRRGGVSYYFPNAETSPGDLFVKPPITSARRENMIGREAGVRAARHLERQNEHIRGGLDKRANMVIGSTLRVFPQPDWKLLQDAAPGLFADDAAGRKWAKDFAGQCYRWFNNWGYDQRVLQDAEGHSDFGGLMWMAFRNYAGAEGETAGFIGYDQPRADAYLTRWATYIGVLDPDRIKTPPLLSGNELYKNLPNIPQVSGGIEQDKNGRMTGMWVTNGHPSDGGEQASTYERIPRENSMGRPMAWHYFQKRRAGAVRGLTTLITVLRMTGMFDQYDDAALGNAVKAASFATYIETMASAETVAEQLAPAGEDNVSPFDTKLGYYGKVRIRFGNQRVAVLPPGDKVQMQGMDNAITDPSAFRNGFLRAMASALGISFEQISNNFSEANYSSARAALLEMWRGVIVDRTFFTSRVASQIYSAVIEEAIAKGWIKLPPGAPDFYEFRAAYVSCAWTGPAMGWIDPQKEANAQAIRLANKTRTRQREIAEDGGDWTEVFEQLAEEDAFANELGIALEAPTTLKQAGNPALPGADDPEDPANNPDEPPKKKIAKGNAQPAGAPA